MFANKSEVERNTRSALRPNGNLSCQEEHGAKLMNEDRGFGSLNGTRVPENFGSLDRNFLGVLCLPLGIGNDRSGHGGAERHDSDSVAPPESPSAQAKR